MQIAGLLIDDAVAGGGGVQHREVRMFGQRAHGPGLDVVGIQVEFAVAIRTEVDGVPYPHRVDIIGMRGRLRNAHHRFVAAIEQPQDGIGTAAIMLPLHEGRRERVIRDLLAIRRPCRAGGVRHLQFGLDAAVDRHREQFAEAIVERRARRREHHRLAVRRKALHHVGARMPGQALRYSTFNRQQVDIDVAIDLRAVGDQLAVRRKHRIGFFARVGGQAARRAAVDVGQPHVAGVDKGQVPRRQRGLGQHARIAGAWQRQRGQRYSGQRQRGRAGCYRQHFLHCAVPLFSAGITCG